MSEQITPENALRERARQAIIDLRADIHAGEATPLSDPSQSILEMLADALEEMPGKGQG